MSIDYYYEKLIIKCHFFIFLTFITFFKDLHSSLELSFWQIIKKFEEFTRETSFVKFSRFRFWLVRRQGFVENSRTFSVSLISVWKFDFSCLHYEILNFKNRSVVIIGKKLTYKNQYVNIPLTSLKAVRFERMSLTCNNHPFVNWHEIKHWLLYINNWRLTTELCQR